MPSRKSNRKPQKPDTEIITVLHMLATGEKWGSIEDKTSWSRSTISLARDWYLSLDDEDAAKYVSRYGSKEHILLWRTGQKLAKRGPTRIEEDAPPEESHREEIRDAIRWWRDNLAALPTAELVELPQRTGFSGWGVTVSVTAKDGSSRADPVYGEHALRDSLRGHLVPPAVEVSFWDTVDEMPGLVHNLYGAVMGLSQRVEREVCRDTGQPFLQGDFRREPVTGLTGWYARTIMERALGVSTVVYQAYLRLAVVYGDGGVVITSTSEGLRLLYQQGWDPGIQTTWEREAAEWVEPADTGHRVLIGEADWVHGLGSWPLRFVLCTASREIALAATPEELDVCYQVHRRMMADADTRSEAQAIKRMRERLDIRSKRVTENLGRALLQKGLPGSCPRCNR